MATDPFASPPMSDSLRTLARRGELKRFRKGQRLINEGELGDTLFIVLEGRIRAFGENEDGKKIIYNDYGPGEYVGEMSLDGGPRSANVEALRPTLCARGHRVAVRRGAEQRLWPDEGAAGVPVRAGARRRAGLGQRAEPGGAGAAPGVHEGDGEQGDARRAHRRPGALGTRPHPPAAAAVQQVVSAPAQAAGGS